MLRDAWVQDSTAKPTSWTTEKKCVLVFLEILAEALGRNMDAEESVLLGVLAKAS